MANLKNEHIPTAEQRALVFEMASDGQPQYEIVNHIGVSLHTLRKHYRQELDEALVVANERVKQTAYQLATSGECPAMTMFWLKCRDNWKETSNLDVTSGGQPIKALIGINIDEDI